VQSSGALVISAGSSHSDRCGNVACIVLCWRSISIGVVAVAAAKCVLVRRPYSRHHADDEGFFVLFRGGGLGVAGLLLIMRQLLLGLDNDMNRNMKL